LDRSTGRELWASPQSRSLSQRQFGIGEAAERRDWLS